MQYFLQSGRLPNLSFAELVTVLESSFSIRDAEKYVHQVSDKVFVVNLPEEKKGYDISTIFYRFGGFIRIGEIVEDQETFLSSFNQKNVEFGISLILNDNPTGPYTITDVKKLANNIKAYFKTVNVTSRFVLPIHEEYELNAAQVIKNKLVEVGFELCLIEKKDGTYLSGRTLKVQDVDEYTKRDYERPYADKEMGMLPPKLARMMVNLAGLTAGATLWDPFCGSGTILTEAMTLGYHVLGSDISRNAIFFTEENIKWVAEKYKLKDIKSNIFLMDITRPERKMVSLLSVTDIDAIVCEPFMGPPQKRIMTVKKAENLINGVLEQYKALITLVETTNKRGIRLVLVVPSYKTDQGWVAPRITTLLSKRWSIVNKKFGRDLQYRRSNSIISRNILLLEIS